MKYPTPPKNLKPKKLVIKHPHITRTELLKTFFFLNTSKQKENLGSRKGLFLMDGSFA